MKKIIMYLFKQFVTDEFIIIYPIGDKKNGKRKIETITCNMDLKGTLKQINKVL